MRKLVLFVAGLAAGFAAAQGKKFIELGWDIPDTAYLKAHHASMQRETPFDGVVLELEGVTPEGRRLSSQSMMDSQPWAPAWFAAARSNLAACAWTTFTDNFIRVNFTPGTIAWDDDAGWRVFCVKSGLAARIAKEAGLKGLAIDFELYGEPIFTYSAKSGHTFAEAQARTRQRGREWMTALAAHYPDMALLTLFVLDYVPLPKTFDDPQALLEKAHYGLLPAFYNGMLDAVPAGMTIIDGCESGYYHNGETEFMRRAFALQSPGGPAIRHIAPENRAAYIRQVQVGFGFYLDMYANPEGSVFYRGAKPGGTRLGRLEENLTAARNTADTYVWVYGEQRRWWPPPKPDTKWEHWETALPGVTGVIARVKNPRLHAERAVSGLLAAGAGSNCLANAGFDRSIDSWERWQDKPLGTFDWDADKGSARAIRVQWGCYLQSVPVHPGQCFYVAADSFKQGEGTAALSVRWQDKDKRWISETEDTSAVFTRRSPAYDSRPLAEGWTRADCFVRVPETAAYLIVMPGVRGQSVDADIIWFDNALLLHLP